MELQHSRESRRSTIDTLRGLSRWWRHEVVSRKLDVLMNKTHGPVRDLNGTEVRVEHQQMSRYTTTITRPTGDSFYRTLEVVINHEARPFTARRNGFEATFNYYAADDAPAEPVHQAFYDSQADPATNTAHFSQVTEALRDAVAVVNSAQHA